MLKTMTMGVAVAALAIAAMQTEARANPGSGISVLDILDEIGSESKYEQGPDCDWIEKQVRKVGSAYWKNRYREECTGEEDQDD